MTDIWNLDGCPDYSANERREYLRRNGYNKGKHEAFAIGETIEFMTGYDNHLRARAKIKGIDGVNLYVYNDCYWFPIQSTDVGRKIVKV